MSGRTKHEFGRTDKKTKDLKNFKNYYKEIQPNPRNELMIIMGLNTALKISDILELKWQEVYDFERKEYKHFGL